MNSLNDIWQMIIDRLSLELTPTAVNTWFGDCSPVELNESTLVIQVGSDFKRDTIKARYANKITAALEDIFSEKIELLVLTAEDMEDYQSRSSEEEPFPEMLAYSFDRFIVGSSNTLAHAASLAVAENPGKLYNPLFIYGNSGLGKTHLMLSIGHAIRDRSPGTSIAYLKGDQFANELINSIRTGETEAFRQKYRKAELFLVDDVQFIAGKERTQEEFFHTFNAIYEAGHQIVITSDRPPAEMLNLVDRLRSRFEGGLMADIQPPDLETRIAIIHSKATALGLTLSDEFANYIAEKITSNIRQIEGVINKLTAYSRLEGGLTMETLNRAIKGVIKDPLYTPSPEVIIEETCRFFAQNPEDVRGPTRSKYIAMARQVSMYLIRTMTNLGLADIGNQFEGRNHSTVLSSVNKIESMIQPDSSSYDKSIADAVRDISANINSRHNNT